MARNRKCFAHFAAFGILVLGGCRTTQLDEWNDEEEEGLVSALDVPGAIATGVSLAGRIATKEVSIKPGSVIRDAGLAPGEIALTLDDGPKGAITETVLNLFKAYDVRANFFLVGKNVGAGKDLVNRMVAEGHSVSNHSWDHSYFDTLTLAAAQKQVKDTDEALKKAFNGDTSKMESIFRFPGGESRAGGSARVDNITSLGKAVAHWNLDTHDTSVPNRRLTRSWSNCDAKEYGSRFCDLITTA